MMSVTMPITELEDIRKSEKRYGEDIGAKSTISHIRWLIVSPDTPDRLVFKDKDCEEKKAYDEIRKFIEEHKKK